VTGTFENMIGKRVRFILTKSCELLDC